MLYYKVYFKTSLNGVQGACQNIKIFFIGNGYIPVSSLREILQELDPKLTSNEIDGIIDEIDKDGSGTVDFDGILLNNY